MFEEQRIIFTCSQVKLINNKKSNEMKKYRNEIDLFGKVKPAVSLKTSKYTVNWPVNFEICPNESGQLFVQVK